MYILFIYIRIYVLNYFVFMLFVYYINDVILTLRNVEYQFNTKYSNSTITLC